ncbi:MAG: quinolinate synthase NadA [Methanocellales archaeon]
MKEIRQRILELKAQRRAIILAHNYQLPEIQQIADYVGDSLDLSQRAAACEAEVIVFCGVDFMAESAAILCPDKKVLVPDLEARCPMAAMITPAQLKIAREKHPDSTVVCYVNTTAAVKAESDICCTSANAVKVVDSLPDQKIIFIPDKYLAAYVASKVKGKHIIPWEGFCPTHEQITLADLLWVKEEHPEAEVLVHPECKPEVIANADFVYSTGGMVKHVRNSNARKFLIGTEIGLIYRLKRENPEKEFYPISNQAICANMKRNTLEKVLHCLEKMEFEVKVPEDVRRRAKQALDRMLEVRRGD